MRAALDYGDCQLFEMCVGSLVCRLMFWVSVQVYSFGLGRDSTMAHIAWMSVGACAFTTIHALLTEQIWDQFEDLLLMCHSQLTSELCVLILDCVCTNYLTMCVAVCSIFLHVPSLDPQTFPLQNNQLNIGNSIE